MEPTPATTPPARSEAHQAARRAPAWVTRARRRLTLAVALTAGVLAILAPTAANAPAASAALHLPPVPPAVKAEIHRVVWGIDDQHVALFNDPRWGALPLRHVRYFVPWDLTHEPHYLHLFDLWMHAANREKAIPLVAITQSDLPGRTRMLPSAAEYERSVRWIMHRVRWVKDWTPWNEANLLDQATLHHPAVAADYWRIMRRLCHACIVTSPSLVGYRDASRRWMRAFVRAARGLHGPWAIHVYNDINEFNMVGLRQLLHQMPSGPVWVTEVGGWLRFVGYPQNLTRQSRAVGFIFEAAVDNFPRITRWYLYQWFASSQTNRWDSGLLNSNGTARPALRVVEHDLD